MNTRWWTSDHHFSHTNIIKFCDRPYRDKIGEPVPHYMNLELVRLHNETVNETDKVWFLGDLALGHWQKNLAWAKQCAGQKIFLTGNHDKNFQKNPEQKTSPHDDTYKELGNFETILHGTQKITLMDGTAVNVSHFPYHDPTHNDLRYQNHRPVDDGSWLIHGHVHEKWRQKGRMINVGVDAWAGKPVNEETIIELINKGENNLEPQPWY